MFRVSILSCLLAYYAPVGAAVLLSPCHLPARRTLPVVPLTSAARPCLLGSCALSAVGEGRARLSCRPWTVSLVLSLAGFATRIAPFNFRRSLASV